MWSFNKVLQALKEIHYAVATDTTHGYSAYYMGGSLCIDFKYTASVVLNKNGRGFFYAFKDNSEKSDVKFVMTDEMHKYVMMIYEKVKGSSDE